jgi:hypothetical protein
MAAVFVRENRLKVTMMRKTPPVWLALTLLMSLAGFLLKEGFTKDDVFGIPFMAFTLVGAVVATRQPKNPVGWLLLFVGASAVMGFFSGAYAVRSLRGAGLPAADVAEWVSSWIWFPGIGCLITFVLLLFPEGKLPSPRWRLVGYAAAFMLVLVTLSLALVPGPMDPFDPLLPSRENPFGVEAFRVIEPVAFALFPLLGVVSAASLFFRYRSASLQQRQQIKWFAFSSVVLVMILLFEELFDQILGSAGAEIVFLIGMIFPSIGAGVGILKYRLYDIDVVINRTLVYLALTAILAGCYLGIVFLLQGLLDDVTRESDLAVAASTLAVAALFRPLRARVQDFIDLRFYRTKYDAAETLRDFSSRLRSHVDLDSLARELAATVSATMQPSHLSIWIRSSEASR